MCTTTTKDDIQAPAIPAVEKTEATAAPVAATTEDEVEVKMDGKYEVVAGPELTDGKWDLPEVHLEEKDVKTGEEDEEVFWSHRAKLYRWAATTSEWKERATGDAKLLRHKEKKYIRFIIRQEKTLKVAANFYVQSHEVEKYCTLEPNAGSEKIWTWLCNNLNDDGVTVSEQLSLKFGAAEFAKEFEGKWNEAKKINDDLLKEGSAK